STGIHHSLGLPSSAMNFDITNACLGFVNAMTMASSMIDSGQIRYALVVGAEDVEEVQRGTVDRLNSKTSTRADFNNQFASLTLGSGAAAAVLGPADAHPEGHRLKHTQARAGTEHHELCVANMQDMRTDSAGLLENGIQLILDTWKGANEAGYDFKSIDFVVPHQVSTVYVRNFSTITGVGMERIPVTLADWGNVAAEAVPMTLAHVQDDIEPGQRVLLMGVGSGLNTATMEVQWRAPPAAPDADGRRPPRPPRSRPCPAWIHGCTGASRCATTAARPAAGTCWTPGRCSPSAASPPAAPSWPCTATPPGRSCSAPWCGTTSRGG